MFSAADMKGKVRTKGQKTAGSHIGASEILTTSGLGSLVFAFLRPTAAYWTLQGVEHDMPSMEVSCSLCDRGSFCG